MNLLPLGCGLAAAAGAFHLLWPRLESKLAQRRGDSTATGSFEHVEVAGKVRITYRNGQVMSVETMHPDERTRAQTH